MYSLLNQDSNSLWTTSVISLSKRLLIYLNHALTRKGNTGRPPCPPMQVSSPPTSTYIVQSNTTGVPAVTLRTRPSVMVSASGSWPVAVLCLSTFPNQDTSSFAIARCQPMHHSAMALIRPCSNILTRHIEGSGAYRESHHSGYASHIGCSLFTSERKLSRSIGMSISLLLFGCTVQSPSCMVHKQKLI